MINSTLAYLQKNGQVLLLYRNKKKNDLNAGKWIGVGGKLEEGESPDDCLLREVQEETGLRVTQCQLRGLITFVSDQWETEQMFLYTVDAWDGTLTDCTEGTLCWKPWSDVPALPLWEGDRVFLPLLRQDIPFFRMKLCYQGDTLLSVHLNGTDITKEALTHETV